MSNDMLEAISVLAICIVVTSILYALFTTLY